VEGGPDPEEEVSVIPKLVGEVARLFAYGEMRVLEVPLIRGI